MMTFIVINEFSSFISPYKTSQKTTPTINEYNKGDVPKVFCAVYLVQLWLWLFSKLSLKVTPIPNNKVGLHQSI